MFDTFQRYIFPYTRFKKLSDEQKIINIADVGANDAGFSRYLTGEVNLTNIDIKKFDPHLKKLYPQVLFVTYDGKKLPFKDNAFDLVMSIDTLEHVPPKDREQFIREVIRISKKEVIFSFPVSTSAPYEKIVNALTLNKIVFLQEHFVYGLPNDSEFRNILHNIKGSKLEEVHDNINLVIWIPLKLFSSIIYRIFKNNKNIEKKLFFLYKDYLSKFVNFGKGYSKTYWIKIK